MKPGDASDPSDERELPALAWMRRAGAEDELLREIRAKVKRRRLRRAATAAAGAMMLALGAVAFRAWQPAGAARPASTEIVATTATATVVRPSVRTLADGSVVELKDGARIEVNFSAGFRRITLLSGEAHFQVTKNKARPFIVTAGKVDVQAVGTAFSVQLATEAVDVVVTEGTVQVDSEAAKGRAPAMVDAGRRCVVDAELKPRIEVLSGADAGERLAWRVPQLEFSRTPLSEVVDLMNRHAPPEQRMRFEIADRELTAIKLTGYLRADNTEGLVRWLENNFHVRSEREGEKVVFRRAR